MGVDSMGVALFLQYFLSVLSFSVSEFCCFPCLIFLVTSVAIVQPSPSPFLNIRGIIEKFGSLSEARSKVVRR